MSNTKLAQCPCGAVPESLSITDTGQGGKYMSTSGDCCGEWSIEFRANYTEGAECMKRAVDAWNATPRGWL